MRNKKGIVGQIVLFVGLLLIGLIGLIGIVIAQSSFLEDESSQLEQELINSVYGWLVNYNLTTPSIEVYEVDGNKLKIGLKK